MKKNQIFMFILILSLLLNCLDCIAAENIKYYPIIVKGVLLGGYGNGTWWEHDNLFKRLSDKQTYQIYSLTEKIGIATGEKISKKEEYEPPRIIIIHPKYRRSEHYAISCDWNPLPRLPKILSNNNEAYRKIVQDILHEHKIKNVPNIEQIIQVDLEGDGNNEVIIVAKKTTADFSFFNNEYSFLLVRKMIQGKVKNIFLEEEFIINNDECMQIPPSSYRIRGLFDADGDGILEILVETWYFEGGGYLLYKWDGSNFQLVLSNVDGL